jgi:phosphohistidine phosphatase
MKTLYLLRHAKSSWDNPQLRDFDRPLNASGFRDAAEMATRLQSLLQGNSEVLGLILTSPALRTCTTAEIIAAKLNLEPEQVQMEPQIYLASSGRLLQLVRRFDDSISAALLVAHNPALTDFANEMSNSLIEDIPTCGLVALQLPIMRWADAEPGAARLLSEEFPSETEALVARLQQS